MLSAERPTEADLKGIAAAVAESREEVAKVLRQLKDAAIAKFTGYMADGPGYCGDVFVVVWPGGPEIVDVLTRQKSGELVANLVDSQAPVTNVWGEDEEYARGDWQYEVNCGYTNLGYWAWVSERRAVESNG